MAELSIKPMTVDEFLRWEEDQPEAPRFELIEGVPRMMSPERAHHVRVKTAVLVALSRAASRANLGCEVFNEGLTIPVSERNGYKPDVHVTCEAVEGHTVLSEKPIIVVEVLSPATASFDRGAKLIGYFSLPSLVHYLLVEPVEQRVEHHQRKGDEISKQLLGSGMLRLDPPGLEVDIADFFSLRW